MKKFPSVTVLVTVKNAKDTIDKCIKSLLNLNYPSSKYKIFVTDAYSTDGTFEILEKLRKKNPKRIKLERIKGNIAKAHNYMIKKSNTDFIAMTDADCVVDKNWLKNLISDFTSNNIIATTGFCSTPDNVNRLQRLIGMELEDRFKRAPKFVPRGPTMNLCVKTEYAKKVKFNERFDVAQETDWGYRLTKLGKMVYVPKAIVWHHHRSTWKGFFKQQFNYGRHMPLLYFKHKRMSIGDHISKLTMILQQFIFILVGLSLIISIFFNSFIILTLLLVFSLILLYSIDIFRLARKVSDGFLLFVIFVFRNVAWTTGLIFGVFDLIFRR